MAAIMMRRILVNHAIARQAARRDVLLVALTLSEAQQVAGVGAAAAAEVVKVRDALPAFEQQDARAAAAAAGAADAGGAAPGRGMQGAA